MDDADTTLRGMARQLLPSDQREAGARLVVLVGREPGRRYPLGSNKLALGRAPECDVVLEDARISRHHAELTPCEGSWTVRDLGSRNGLLVNGARVHEAKLEFGDRIQLASNWVFLFTQADPLADLLLHRQQMEVIGHMAAGIAHDFNNLLSVVTATAEHLIGLAHETAIGAPEVVESLDDIARASRRATELTARLLLLARRRDEQRPFEPVALDALCADVLALARRTFARSIVIETAVEPGIEVVGDAGSLHQLLMNLCINARDAMPNGGTLRLEAQLDHGPRVDSRAVRPDGAEVVVRVIDTGIGMDARTRERAFEPFFTTKKGGTGSGLGLSTVYEIATQHGGVVDIESELGRGSTVRIRLPARQWEAEPVVPTSSLARTMQPIPPVKRALVLIVDDEELVRRALGRLVSTAGHEVCFAANGREATMVYASRRPDLVLLDLDMPQVSGEEWLQSTCALDPRARVIIVTGYHDDSRRKRLIAGGALDFLPKPVERARLRQAIDAALGRTNPPEP